MFYARCLYQVNILVVIMGVARALGNQRDHLLNMLMIGGHYY
jgi:hypothetical protein